MKKALALILVLVLAVGMLAGCGGKGGNSGKGSGEAITELTLPLTKEKQELSVWTIYSGTIVSNLNDIAGIKKMEEMTNVHINWIPVEQQQGGDKFGLLLTSDNLPDIINYNNYPGGLEKGISDGVIRKDMPELIDKYMPNYKKYLEENDYARKQATFDDGTRKVVRLIVGEDFNCKAEGTYQGLAYRKDLLEGLGLAEPKTIAEWHDALVKAKESGINTPFVLHQTGGSHLSLSWGVETINDSYLQIEGDKVVGSALQDGFGEYLDTMRAWYAEGLIDPNFTSFNYYLNPPASVENNEHLLYSWILSAFTGNNYYQMHMCNNESEFLQPIAAPAVKEGDEVVQSGDRIESKDFTFISTNCKNPELAAKWIDFLYTKEGELLNWYGIEGESYTMENGVPTFTDAMFSDPNGLAASDVLQKYALGWGSCWIGKHNTAASEKVSTVNAGGTNQQKEAVDIWSAPKKNINFSRSTYTLTEEESDKINAKMTAVKTLIDEHMLKYIIGEDNTSFEDFKAQLLQYGYQEIIDTYQASLDRFNKR